MNRVKKWMISTLVTICILFVLVAALVIYVDPFFQSEGTGGRLLGGIWLYENAA